MKLRNNKWMKWFVGIGSVSSIAVIFSFLQPEGVNLANSIPTFSISKVDVAEGSNTDINTLKEQEKANREEWISTLDWEEGNWDVDKANVGVTLSPRKPIEGMPQVEVRTRRS